MDIKYRVASCTSNYTYFDYFNEAYNFACAETLRSGELVFIDRLEMKSVQEWVVTNNGEVLSHPSTEEGK